MEYLFGHTSQETALEVTGYPYGRLRTSIFYWIETVAKKGDRFCSYTINPKNGRINAPKKSTFSNIMVMTRNPENGHIGAHALGVYDASKVGAYVDAVGFDNLNSEQQKQVSQLRGEVIAPRDKITGDALKDYKIKWEKNSAGDVCEVRITFDRPDGVKIKEIFAALKSINQEKLLAMFEGWESKHYGRVEGFARICVRGGMQLGTVNKATYLEYLASDHTQTISEPTNEGN
jgi:hypothetical protein